MTARDRVGGWVWVASALFPLAAVALTVAAARVPSSLGVSLPAMALAASALVVAGLVALPTRSGRRVSAAVGVAAALPFVFRSVGSVALDGVVAAEAVGLAALWVLRTARGDDPRGVFVDSYRQLAGFVLFAWVFAQSGSIAEHVPPSWQDMPRLMAAALAWFVLDLVLAAVVELRPRDTSQKYQTLVTARDADAFAAVVGSGALFGLAFPAISWWALLVAVLPYAFAHTAFHRFRATKDTYGQTIRALSRIPEVAGLATTGHADRTAELAVSVAKELGLRPSLVDAVGYAAQMHDIGRITLNEPSILRLGFTDEDIARWGAEIIGETPYLSDVAGFVARQYDSYRKPGEERDPDVPLPARIIRVASAYDKAVHDEGLTALQAMEQLHQGSVYDFDPDVVASLRRVLEARRAFSQAPLVG